MPPAADDSARIDLHRDVAVPMADGTVLRADVYLPAGDGRPLPTLVTRTAYGKSGPLTQAGDIHGLVRRGYAVVVQDKRGRFASDGAYRILRDDSAGGHHDGHDTVEWVAQQPWSDGQVGVWGLSYLGHATLGAAVAQPPHLGAAVSIQPSTDEFTDRTFTDGVLNLAIADWATSPLVGPSLIARLPEDERAAAQADLDAYAAAGEGRYDRLPIVDWPFLRLFPMLWTDPIAHREDAEFFAENRIGEAEAARVQVPIRHVGGWCDVFTRNSVRHFELMQRLAPGGDRHQLVMGPWAHGQLGLDAAGDRPLPGAGVDTNALVDEWMRRWLLGDQVTGDAMGPTFGAQPDAVIYVMGADRWRAEPTWPIPGTVTTAALLAADGTLTLEDTDDVATGTRAFDYDPREAYRAPSVVGGPKQVSGHAGDGRLVWTSAPLTADLEVTGWPGAVLHAETTATDTDWLVELHVVHSDGTALLVDEGIARARYRAGRAQPTPVTPGEVGSYAVGLRPISLVVPAGGRLRVVVSGGKLPAYERNPQAFVEPSTATEADLVAATHTVHCGPGLSRLELPVVPPEAAGTWVDNPWPLAGSGAVAGDG